MRKQDFHFDLPEGLIAQFPLATRDASRLLHAEIEQSRLSHRAFVDLPSLLRSGDLLVFNNTQVIPARLYATKPSGGRVEILLERVLSEQTFLAQCRASKPVRVGQRLVLADGAELEVIGREGAFWIFSCAASLACFVAHGAMPLPPYIKRSVQTSDAQRYQTVYAKVPGAVAAPTAGLHFTPDIMSRLQEMSVETAYVTLHVAAGTFQPLRVDEVSLHRMHKEYCAVDAATCAKINRAKASGRRVIAVGTTSVRVLESACRDGVVEPYVGDTDIFIYPGYRFQVMDALLTNFHLPESSLIMLVAAFAGHAFTLRAYREAVAQAYRFFSYGDAMFIER
jgi:S-adenosylmethionine:tRNA ribosyltransferase-isomerase